MPAISEDSDVEKSERLNKNFIRIQNLPWTACTAAIKNFFKDLSIMQGGILVRNYEAYVAFENPADIHLAMYRKNILLHGCKLELSVVDEDELHKILCQAVRRKLDFESVNKRTVGRFHFEETPRRKIRPTPVRKGDKQRSESFSTFIPAESDSLSHSHSVEDCSFSGMFVYGKRSVGGIKRLHPTSVSQTINAENLAMFHPEECYLAKKMKLDE